MNRTEVPVNGITWSEVKVNYIFKKDLEKWCLMEALAVKVVEKGGNEQL